MLLRHLHRRHRLARIHHGDDRDHCDHRHRLTRRSAGVDTVQPDISVVIPAHNERSRVASTIQSIARARISGARVEFVIVDDASTDGTVANLVSALPRLLDEPAIDIRVESLDHHSGNYHARNRGAEVAAAPILFMTDAHVEFSPGWDDLVLRRIRPNRILAGTTVQRDTGFRSSGCKLAIPRMGTIWNEQEERNAEDTGEAWNRSTPLQIATCHATALERDLFLSLGGYDTGMLLYGGGGPEFSVRAWTRGAEIHSLPGLEVTHEFKPRDQFAAFLYSIRHIWVHNCLRFALLYRSELGCLQVLQHYSQAHPEEFQEALRLLEQSDVWERRVWLEKHQRRSFDWYIGYFGIHDEAGNAVV
jgi:glycosyltransferase involved in cell wall biosynthesis